LKVAGEDVVDLTAAPGPGQHTESVLTSELGYDADKIAALRAAGALGED
jgi:crotonobetainyl-CoA:carnitine CoA-transferase CaiB-like acyl-CoA transferase